MTQQAIADDLGCHQGTIAKASNIPNCDIITIGNTPQKTDDRGTSQDYLFRRVADAAPELIPEIGKHLLMITRELFPVPAMRTFPGETIG